LDIWTDKAHKEGLLDGQTEKIERGGQTDDGGKRTVTEGRKDYTYLDGGMRVESV
jgi:hypothetical protein